MCAWYAEQLYLAVPDWQLLSHRNLRKLAPVTMQSQI